MVAGNRAELITGNRAGLPPAGNRGGFVMALRAHLFPALRAASFVATAPATPAIRHPRRAIATWLIVARWGQNGRYLSLSWTDIPATTAEAPLQLTPRRTIIGLLDPRPHHAPHYRLTTLVPDHVTVATAFVPAVGIIRLDESRPRLRLRCHGHAVGRSHLVPLPTPRPRSWRLDAEQRPWIGEFLEAPFHRRW